MNVAKNLSVNLEKECTFQPKINEKSEKLRPRTAFELSRGDFFRKETNRLGFTVALIKFISVTLTW